MRHIIRKEINNLFITESLESDFIDVMRHHPDFDKYKGIVNELEGQIKSEFLYRVSDGENIITVLKDIFPRLSDEETVTFDIIEILWDYDINKIKNNKEYKRFDAIVFFNTFKDDNLEKIFQVYNGIDRETVIEQMEFYLHELETNKMYDDMFYKYEDHHEDTYSENIKITKELINQLAK